MKISFRFQILEPQFSQKFAPSLNLKPQYGQKFLDAPETGSIFCIFSNSSDAINPFSISSPKIISPVLELNRYLTKPDVLKSCNTLKRVFGLMPTSSAISSSLCVPLNPRSIIAAFTAFLKFRFV